MYKDCEYIHPAGKQCGSPAMRDSSFCYHHRRRLMKPSTVTFPMLTNSRNIQVALTSVLQGLITGRLHLHEAGQLLYGIQMAVVEEDKKLRLARTPRVVTRPSVAATPKDSASSAPPGTDRPDARSAGGP